ncbi:MAG TPA: MBL fold metallo-hydrolase [Sphingobacteriaceae bacterium]
MRIHTIILLLMIQTGFAQTSKSLKWIGGPTFLLQLGSFKILSDPMLGNKTDSAFIINKHPTTGETNSSIKRLVDPASMDLNGIDLLLISHTHPDHVDVKAKTILSKDISVITTRSGVADFQKSHFSNVKALQWNDSTRIIRDGEELLIIAVKALHAGEEPLRSALGEVNGYVLEYSNGSMVYRTYWTGDTVWFNEINDLSRLGQINLFIPHMGGVGAKGPFGLRSLDTHECLKIMNALSPELTIPVHHTTFSHYDVPVKDLQKAFKTGGSGKLIVPKAGKTISLD